MDITRALAVLDDAAKVLDEAVGALPPRRWLRPTPARGWNISHQIGHLAWSDAMALQALRQDPAFAQSVGRMETDGASGFVDRGARERAAVPVPQLLEEWRAGREALREALSRAAPKQRITWLGPPVLPRTMVAARTVETWAHSLDVFDALGEELPDPAALPTVARMGIRTREASFRARRIPLPERPVRVELELPGGEKMAFGPEGAPERVVGAAWGFAAVVTQRRNVADVELEVAGEGAARWMRIAQAFGGVPTNGPRPGERLAWHAH
ncbi:TIGR03084 family metal-binding protein [Leucobacter sp. BZR 635]